MTFKRFSQFLFYNCSILLDNMGLCIIKTRWSNQAYLKSHKPCWAACVCVRARALVCVLLCCQQTGSALLLFVTHTDPSLSSLKPHAQPSSSAHWKGLQWSHPLFLSVRHSRSHRHTCRFLKQSAGFLFNRWARLCRWKNHKQAQSDSLGAYAQIRTW